MAEAFIRLSPGDRREALEVAATASARPIHLLEKDVWVVWALSVMFGNPFGDRLVFKGGTSLSKAHNAIRRFSEDVDLTYDIRELIPELIGEDGDTIPPSRTQEKRWTSRVRKRLPQWIAGTAVPALEQAVRRDGIGLAIRQEGEKVYLDYEAVTAGTGYVSPRVMLEFGARSTGEPSEPHDITCDAAPHIDALEFPHAQCHVMRVERTFWEKATAAHVFCAGAELRGKAFARHWHDLARLDDAGYAERAFADRAIAQDVARHKLMFFRERGDDGNWIDFHAAVNGALRLVPEGQRRTALAEDYESMIEDGLLLDDAESFDALMERCGELESRASRSL